MASGSGRYEGVFENVQRMQRSSAFGTDVTCQLIEPALGSRGV
jgi:hypothetical protein